MKADLFRWLERLLLAAVGLLVLIILAGLFYLYYLEPMELPEIDPTEQTQAQETTPTLSGPEFYLPGNLAFGEKLPYSLFWDDQGQQVDILEEYAGSRLVLMYWGSWCPYCEKQLTALGEFRRVIEASPNTRLVLVNKTDSAKEETLEKAEGYLEEKGWQEYDHVYDLDLAAYQAYGMKRIPTTIVVDEEGYVRAVASRVLEDGEALTEMLEQAQTGGAAPLLSFLKNNMRNSDGGLFTAYRESQGTSPKGHDVLSESMGLLMECAVLLDDQGLFDESFAYVSQKMNRGGVYAWYVDSKGNQANSNALLDDLRIARALYQANKKWGGYEAALGELAGQLLAKNTYRGQLSSFYDFKLRRSGSSICLAYGDFEALEGLAELEGEYAGLAESLKQIVAGGFIGDAFPLYYSSYDYKEQRYSRESLNTAEALLTLYHLCGTELLRQESLQWLKNAIATDTLAARYEVDGTPVAGYQYDSTAVFAIAALIGQKTGDAELYRAAREAMERARVTDPESAFYGTFSHSDNGSDLQSFDQLLPLLVYCRSSQAKFQ